MLVLINQYFPYLAPLRVPHDILLKLRLFLESS
jgi:hypothetical protein